MKERGILFSGEMVRALLDGRKTQTRRLVEPQPEPKGSFVTNTGAGDAGMIAWSDVADIDRLVGPPPKWNQQFCPYGKPGDLLWVREAWRTCRSLDDRSPKQIGEDAIEAGWDRAWGPVAFEVDGVRRDWETVFGVPGRYRHARFMPRWASRITLEITDVRVQRLNEMTNADAMAEGIRRVTKDGLVEKFCVYDLGDYSSTPWAEMPRRPIDAFTSLWDRINGEGSWAANPWVWALTFKRTDQHQERGRT